MTAEERLKELMREHHVAGDDAAERVAREFAAWILTKAQQVTTETTTAAEAREKFRALAHEIVGDGK